MQRVDFCSLRVVPVFGGAGGREARGCVRNDNADDKAQRDHVAVFVRGHVRHRIFARRRRRAGELARGGVEDQSGHFGREGVDEFAVAPGSLGQLQRSYGRPLVEGLIFRGPAFLDHGSGIGRFHGRKNRRRHRGKNRAADRQRNGRHVAVATQPGRPARETGRNREQVAKEMHRRRPARNRDRARSAGRVAALGQFGRARGFGFGDVVQYQREPAEFGHDRKQKAVGGLRAGSRRHAGRMARGVRGKHIPGRQGPIAIDRRVAESG